MSSRVAGPLGGPVLAQAAAKVNLHLAVGAPREDGFHPLDTVYQAIGLHELVSVTSAPAGVRLTVSGSEHVDLGGVPVDASNIVVKAAHLLAERLGVDPAVALHIDKTVPVAGGMAGGSADAGAALLALHRHWEGDLTPAELAEVAAQLGSDVPFTLVGGTARGLGRGEIVQPLADEGEYHWVVVPSPSGLSTPAVYRHFDKLFPDAPAVPREPTALVAALAEGDVAEVATHLHNDLGAAAIDLRPELGALIERGEAEGALRGIVSGSGPTCVFLCDSGQVAESVAEALRGAGHERTLSAEAPATGAVLL